MIVLLSIHHNIFFITKQAGISDSMLRIALEPEAAAFFCQHEKTHREKFEFSSAAVGTKYMVVDLGGKYNIFYTIIPRVIHVPEVMFLTYIT